MRDWDELIEEEYYTGKCDTPIIIQYHRKAALWQDG